MNTFFRPAVLAAMLAASVPTLQVFAQPSRAAKDSADVAVIYNAIVKSENPRATIVTLVANKKNPDTVALVASVAGVPRAMIEAALPARTKDEIAVDVRATQSDPSAASGKQQDNKQQSNKQHDNNQQANNQQANKHDNDKHDNDKHDNDKHDNDKHDNDKQGNNDKHCGNSNGSGFSGGCGCRPVSRS